MPDRKQPVRRFAAIVAIVAAIDLLTKLLASRLLGERVVHLLGPVDLALTYNRGSALGISLGAYTWQLNVIATSAALILAVATIRSLTVIDRRAPMALGLIAGAALGNLTSLLVPPAGVADFLSLRVGATTSVIMNVADLAAYAGVALIIRSLLLVRRAITARRPVPVFRDAEVRIPIFAESLTARRAVSHQPDERMSPPRDRRSEPQAYPPQERAD